MDLLVYNWGIIVVHVFTSFLGGVPLCIPYGSYNGTPLGGTTKGILEGYPSWVLSIYFACCVASHGAQYDLFDQCDWQIIIIVFTRVVIIKYDLHVIFVLL